MAISLSLLLIIAATLLALAVAIAIAYWKFPLHLIYKSKVGYENMLDAINDPLVVVSSNYTVRRANKAYIDLIAGSFSDAIGHKCYTLLRSRSEPCTDCLLAQTFAQKKQFTVERSPHPSGSGTLRIGFSPFRIDSEAQPADCAIEHIRDITLLEKLKTDLEEKNQTIRQAMHKLKQAQRSILEDLRLARLIQEGILPKAAPAVPGLAMAITYHPVADVGGDLYDFLTFSKTKLGIFIGDASGHGLAASLVGTISKMSLFNNSKTEKLPHDMIAAINRDLFMNIQTNHYLTCFLGIFDLEKQVFTYSRAGHPIPIVIRRDGTVHPLESSGTFAGVIEDATFEDIQFTYQTGDRFYLFTDGIYEIQGEAEKYYGYDKFIKLLQEVNSLPLNKIIPEIKERCSSYTINDDYTLLVVEITGENPALLTPATQNVQSQ